MLVCQKGEQIDFVLDVQFVLKRQEWRLAEMVNYELILSHWTNRFSKTFKNWKAYEKEPNCEIYINSIHKHESSTNYIYLGDEQETQTVKS